MIPVLFLAACLPKPGPFVDVVQVDSARAGRSFTLYVGTPDADIPEGGFPTVYMLDADLQFNFVDDRIRRLSEDGVIPPMVLVGVGYGKGDDMRVTDYTPWPDPSYEDSGGGPDFYAFLVEDVVPLVEASYPVTADDAARALCGHSLGGLFASWALFQTPATFRRFLAASPSLPYDSGEILSTENEWAATHADLSLPARVQFTLGDGDGALMALYLDELEERVSAYDDLAWDDIRWHGDYHSASWKDSYEEGLPFLFASDPVGD